MDERLHTRLVHWKFRQALEYCGAPYPAISDKDRMLIEALASLIGDCGWAPANSALGLVIGAAVSTLLPLKKPA